jgi:hypothetical protein
MDEDRGRNGGLPGEGQREQVLREREERRALYPEQFAHFNRLFGDNDPTATSGEHAPERYQYAVERVFDILSHGARSVERVQDVIDQKFLFPHDPRVGDPSSVYGRIAQAFWDRWHTWLVARLEEYLRRVHEAQSRQQEAVEATKAAVLSGEFTCRECGRHIVTDGYYEVFPGGFDRETGAASVNVWHAGCTPVPRRPPMPLSPRAEVMLSRMDDERRLINSGALRCAACGGTIRGGMTGAGRLGIMKHYCLSCSQRMDRSRWRQPRTDE